MAGPQRIHTNMPRKRTSKKLSRPARTASRRLRSKRLRPSPGLPSSLSSPEDTEKFMEQLALEETFQGFLFEELESRGLTPRMDTNGGPNYVSFHVQDPDGFDLQIGNGKRYAKARRESTANAKLSNQTPSPFEPTGWQTAHIMSGS